MNICRNETARLVGMEINESNKCLKSLERVKGIEPSYSAWKAAALPLSYTRECHRCWRQVRNTRLLAQAPTGGKVWP